MRSEVDHTSSTNVFNPLKFAKKPAISQKTCNFAPRSLIDILSPMFCSALTFHK